MELKIVNVKKEGSCNACKKGEISLGGHFNYPYTEVFDLKLNHPNVRLCKDCTVELIELLQSQLDNLK